MIYNSSIKIQWSCTNLRHDELLFEELWSIVNIICVHT